MCITPQHAQQTVLFKTFNHLLSAVLLMICLIPLGSAECPHGQFLHFNLVTYKGVCCITVPLPPGYGFKSCEVNGTPDSIEKCPEGFYQPDNTTTESETTCSKEVECNPEEHLKVPGCESGQNCGSTCICNYERGYCGKFSYDCKKFPKDCPSELVQTDCSCKRDSPQVTSLSPGNGNNKPSQTIMTTPSTAPRDGGTSNKPGGGVDTNNGTANSNGTGNVPDTNNGTANNNVPDQTQSTVLNAAVIAIGIVFAVGLVAVVILVYIFRRRLKKWLLKYRNFCCLNRSTNSEQVHHPLRSVVIIGMSNQDEPQEQGNKESQPFLSKVRSEEGCDDQKNLTAGQSEASTIQSDIQSLVVDNGGSESYYGSQNNPEVGQSDEGSIQAGGTNMQSLITGTEGSDGFCGDQNNPAGDFHSDGGRSVQDGITSIQSLVADVAKTEDCGNGSLFCKCCNLPSSRCRKRRKDIPVGKVNGTRHTAQFLEMPSTGYVGSEMSSINGFLSFTSSINHDLELLDSTNTVDEETTLLKPVNRPADSDDQVLSIVQQRNEVERSRFEDSQQADFSDESHVDTGMPAEEGLYRTDSGVRNQDEEEMTVENEEDVEEQ